MSLDSIKNPSVEVINKSLFSYESEAIVVFTHADSLKILRILRRNFRHCFVVLSFDKKWIICDPLSNFMGLAVIEDVSAEDLIRWYARQGSAAVRTFVRPPRPQPAPVRPFTCVEAVKRVLGIHAGWILTPWALYCYLLQQGGGQKDIDSQVE